MAPLSADRDRVNTGRLGSPLLLMCTLFAASASAAPRITVTSPADGSTSTASTVHVTARLDVNAIEVRAIDAAGESDSVCFRVARRTAEGLILRPTALSIA